MKKITLILPALFVFNIGFSQNEGAQIADLLSTKNNPKNNAIEWAFFKEGNSYSQTSVNEICSKLLSSRSEDSWELIRSEQDQVGFVHDRYQQKYRGIEIEGGVYIFHFKNGSLKSANGDFIPNIGILITPWINDSQAMSFAMDKLGSMIVSLNVEQSSAEMLITMMDSKPVLAYKCQILSHAPHVNKSIYIDAQTGKFLKEINHICEADVVGTASTQFSGVQSITTNSVSASNFELQQAASGGGIVTLKASTGLTYTDSDNNWNNVNASQDEFATDVHFGAESTYDFYFTNFGRNSFDNLGTVITSYANDNSVGVNAYWSGGAENAMYYGDGDADYFPVASLDVAGHELSHGVTEYSASLIYADESGALNESFSDIFGNTIRFLYAPSVATWYVGDQLLRPGGTGDIAFRNMSDPNEFENADTYQGLFFNNGDIVHYDSGIQNFWYYLLVEGGTGTNDIGNNYAVSGIGLNDAMRIAYRNLTVYLTPSSTFADARDGSEQAAIDLFGLCSPQHFAVVHAWYAVGVGNNDVNGSPNATFNQSADFSCTAPFSVNFTSSAGYESYAWNFGDGGTSSIQNPSHTYTSNGNYNVTLTVTNTSVCPGQDIETISNAVVINALSPEADFSVNGVASAQSPIQFTDESLYGPISWQWNFGDGGTSTLQNPTHMYTAAGTYTVTLIVQNCAGYDTIISTVVVNQNLKMCLNTTATASSGVIYDSGGQSGNYNDDENCSMLISPCNATSITLTFPMVSLEFGYDYLYVYDGTNAGAPLLAQINGASAAPVTATSGNVFLKFESDFSVTEDGFKIEYTSNSVTNANFSSTPFYPGAGQTVQFTDLSQSNPTSWAWNFGDGGTSSLQNPTHVYTQSGTYTVTLTSSFCGNVTDVHTFSIVIAGGAGIQDLSATKNELMLAPNPTSSFVQILSESNISKLNYRLVDLSGRIIETGEFNHFDKNAMKIEPATISSGNYLLEIEFESNQVVKTERHRVTFVK